MFAHRDIRWIFVVSFQTTCLFWLWARRRLAPFSPCSEEVRETARSEDVANKLPSVAAAAGQAAAEDHRRLMNPPASLSRVLSSMLSITRGASYLLLANYGEDLLVVFTRGLEVDYKSTTQSDRTSQTWNAMGGESIYFLITLSKTDFWSLVCDTVWTRSTVHNAKLC